MTTRSSSPTRPTQRASRPSGSPSKVAHTASNVAMSVKGGVPMAIQVMVSSCCPVARVGRTDNVRNPPPPRHPPDYSSGTHPPRSDLPTAGEPQLREDVLHVVLRG